jgi:hypothetical protein
MKTPFLLMALFAIHLQALATPWSGPHSMDPGFAPSAPTITGPAIACQASTGNVYQTQSGYSNYVWTVSSGGVITAGGGQSDYTVTVTWNTPGAQTVSVNYDNPPGVPYPNPTTYNVTVKPKPDLTTSPLSKMICSNSMTNITLTSSVPGTTFSWTASLSSGNVIGFSAGTGSMINQMLVNMGNSIGTVTYAITPQANGCTGNVYPYVVTVNPIPYVSNSPMSKTICNNTATNINLLSNVPGATFAWTASGTAGMTGFSSGSGSSINQVLANPGTVTGTVIYHITPSINGCNGSVSDYVVMVYPSPVPSVAGPTPVYAGSTGHVYTTETGLLGYSWTLSSGGVIEEGGANGSSCMVSWNDAGSQWVQVTYISGGCPSLATQYPVEVLPVVTRTWTGTIDSDWGKAGNWSPQGIPAPADDVVIQHSLPNFPVVSVSGFSCHNLTIQPGATFTITTGVTLTVTGTMVMETE